MIRLARPEERLRWDGLMAERHELGFLRFVGRGLRYVAVLGTLWVGMAGWRAEVPSARPVQWSNTNHFRYKSEKCGAAAPVRTRQVPTWVELVACDARGGLFHGVQIEVAAVGAWTGSTSRRSPAFATGR